MKNRRRFTTIAAFILISLVSLGLPSLLWNKPTVEPRSLPVRTTPLPDQGPIPVLNITPVTVSDQARSCTYPVWYWYDHQDAWPGEVLLGEVAYSRDAMQAVFLNQTDDPGMHLLKVLYTTFLNVLYGADITTVEATILEANYWLYMNPPGSQLSELNRRLGGELAAILDGYNSGLFGPGLCPDIPLTGAAAFTPPMGAAASEALPGSIPAAPGSENLPTQPAAAGSTGRPVQPPSNPGPGAASQAEIPALPQEPASIPPAPAQPLPPPDTISTAPAPSALPPVPNTAPPPTATSAALAPTQPPPVLVFPSSTPAAASTASPPANTLPPPPPSNTLPPQPTSTYTHQPSPTASATPLAPTPTHTPQPPPANTLPPPPPVFNGTCTGTLGPVTVDNVDVPSGAVCTLNGTRVKGNISIDRGGVLDANSVSVDGNVQGSGSAVAVTSGSSVGGSIQISRGGSVQIDSSRVGGSVQLIENTGGVAITNNTIQGNLQCKDNSPAPTGGGNSVGGNAEDQCAGMD